MWPTLVPLISPQVLKKETKEVRSSCCQHLFFLLQLSTKVSYGDDDSGRSSDFSGLSAGVRQAAAAATATFRRGLDSLSGSESNGNTDTDNDTDASVRGSPFLHATRKEMTFLGDDCCRAITAA